MQISKAQSLLTLLPVPQDQARYRARSDLVPLETASQGTQITRATRTVEDIKQAELLLKRQRAGSGYEAAADASRQQRAVATYQSLQQSDERAYVSEVLGIDVYA